MAESAHYWWGIFVEAFWSSLGLFVENPQFLWLGLLGAVVTALLVLACRGKEAFMEHIKANIGIAFGGAILTWMLVFPYYVWVIPYRQFATSITLAARGKERERGAVIDRETAELQLRTLKTAEEKAKQVGQKAGACPNTKSAPTDRETLRYRALLFARNLDSFVWGMRSNPANTLQDALDKYHDDYETEALEITHQLVDIQLNYDKLPYHFVCGSEVKSLDFMALCAFQVDAMAKQIKAR